MKVKGILRGKTIELTEAIDLPDGTEIVIDIDEQQFITPEQQNRPLANIIGSAKGSFATPEAVDQFIRQERDAWES